MDMERYVANYLNLAEIDNAVNNNKMAGLQRDSLMQNLLRQKKQMADEDALNSVYNESVNPDGTIDETGLVTKLRGKGLGMKANEVYNTSAANKLAKQKATQEAENSKIDNMAKKAKYGRDVIVQVAPDGSNYSQILQHLRENKFEAANALPDQYDPTTTPALIKQFAMDADSFIKQQGGGSDQEYVYQNTTNGLLKLGKRGDTKPEILINPATNKPYMASSASPELQGEISYSRANARNESDLGYKPQIRAAEATVDLEMKPQIEQKTAQASEIGKNNAKNLQAIPNAEDALTSVQAAKDMLSAGIYAGGYSDMKQKIAKFTPLGDDITLSNTEQFISHIGNTVVPRLQEFGGNDSNEEMRYLKSIMGGDVSMQPETLAKILDSVETKIKRGIEYKQQGLDANGRRVTTKETTPKGTLKNIITLPDGRKLGINAQGKAELAK